MSITLELLSQNYLQVNKTLLSKLGPNQTLVLSLLIDKWKYWNDQDKLESDGSFYKVYEELEQELGMGEREIRNALSKLASEGYISIVRRGLPAKNFYILHNDKILSMISSQSSKKSNDNQSCRNSISGGAETATLEVAKQRLTKIPSTKISIQDSLVEEVNIKEEEKDKNRSTSSYKGTSQNNKITSPVHPKGEAHMNDVDEFEMSLKLIPTSWKREHLSSHSNIRHFMSLPLSEQLKIFKSTNVEEALQTVGGFN